MSVRVMDCECLPTTSSTEERPSGQPALSVSSPAHWVVSMSINTVNRWAAILPCPGTQRGGTMEGRVANVGMCVSRMLSPAAPFSLYTRADFEEAGDCALHSPFSLLGNVDSGSLPEN